MNKLGITLCGKHAAILETACPDVKVAAMVGMHLLPYQAEYTGRPEDMGQLFSAVKKYADGCPICFVPARREAETLQEIALATSVVYGFLTAEEHFLQEADNGMIIIVTQDGVVLPYAQLSVVPRQGKWPPTGSWN